MNKKGYILYAEDESSIRDLLSYYLKKSFPNYEIEAFENGNSLKNRLEELVSDSERIKLILTDNDVPNAEEGIEIIKKYSPKMNSPFILMSGYEKKEEALKAGAYDFVKKPFSLINLSDLVKKSLNDY